MQRYPATDGRIYKAGYWLKAAACNDFSTDTQASSAGAIAFDWPGTRVVFRCRAQRIVLHFSGAQTYFQVRILAPTANGLREVSSRRVRAGCDIAIDLAAQSASATPDDERLVHIAQCSECRNQPVVFHGVSLDGCLLDQLADAGEAAGLSATNTADTFDGVDEFFGAAPGRCSPRLEFIGDSYFVGYGNLLPETAPMRDGLPDDQIDQHTDTQQAMAALAAGYLNLPWRLRAVSGRGLVRNYPGQALHLPTLPECVNQSLHAAPLAPAIRAAQLHTGPVIYVVNLGTNDFSTRPDAGEKYTELSSLRAAFLEKYTELVAQLCTTHAQAKVLLVGVPHPNSSLQASLLQQLAGQLGAHLPVHFCQLPEVGLHGCDAHPNLAGHRQCAQVLAKSLRRILR
ncbi:GDSL-type esterase/lipase family protein [Simiduia sp. 21SJ11W-1]|uniref:GDSL-type esterase/lipase family protein n=1 Tax=Simiduia sp. 21SJ11W-1 TaxID=2909669 RepID=UPI0020A1F3DD|nr:GDSL-type esterase/lipase family protein [Simiduia sp. 21SJ11W-1]UTA48307.1 GDSL-type esterase/lipase family protein [Simiduia sp. 21SJ11W-1]